MKIQIHDDDNGFHGVLTPGPIARARCSVGFNPSGSFRITKAKSLCAAVMQLLLDHGNAARDGEAQRCFRIAADHLEAAQMFAVKGLVREEQEVKGE